MSGGQGTSGLAQACTSPQPQVLGCKLVFIQSESTRPGRFSRFYGPDALRLALTSFSATSRWKNMITQGFYSDNDDGTEIFGDYLPRYALQKASKLPRASDCLTSGITEEALKLIEKIKPDAEQQLHYPEPRMHQFSPTDSCACWAIYWTRARHHLSDPSESCSSTCSTTTLCHRPQTTRLAQWAGHRSDWNASRALGIFGRPSQTAGGLKAGGRRRIVASSAWCEAAGYVKQVFFKTSLESTLHDRTEMASVRPLPSWRVLTVAVHSRADRYCLFSARPLSHSSPRLRTTDVCNILDFFCSSLTCSKPARICGPVRRQGLMVVDHCRIMRPYVAQTCLRRKS